MSVVDTVYKTSRIFKDVGGVTDVKVTYDTETDTLVISLRDSAIKESDEVRPGVIADFDSAGDVVRFEVLSASRVVQNTREMQFVVAE